MTSSLRCGLAMLLCWLALGSPVKAAILFYSMNVRSGGDDELVTVDATTGQITTIGPIGPSIQLGFPSLAVLNGRLFLVHPTAAGDPVQMLELNPSTGAIISSSQVTMAGNSIPLVEGFDTNGGELVISYGPVIGPGFGTRSNRIGTLALDGTISDSVTLGDADDFDGMAVNSSGEFFGSDASSPNVGSDILSISLSPPSSTILATIGLVDTDIVDLAFTESDLLFGLDLDKRIHQIDPFTGNSISSVAFDSSVTLRGLARVPPAAEPVPEPTSLVIWSVLGLAGGGLVWRRRRNQI